MRIIGVDLHTRQQTLAMLDSATGEVVEKTLVHEANNVRNFYSPLSRPVCVGIEATGSMQWFLNLMEELEIECQVGHPTEIRAAEPRKQKHDRRDADLILKLLLENRFPSIWLPSKELREPAGVATAPSSVGTHADASPECATGHCLGERFTTGRLSVEPSRPTHDRVVAVGATYRSSTDRVAGVVREVRGRDRETEPASRGASLGASRSPAPDDPPRSGAGHGVGDGRVPGRSDTVRGRQNPSQLCGDDPE